MLAQQVAKKYSAALFSLVQSRGLIDPASEQFDQLDSLLQKDKSVLQFLLAPHILDQHKTALLRDVFGPRLDPLLLEFLLVLVRKHRIDFLHEIIADFRLLVADAKGIAVAQVTSAIPMTDKERADLKSRLSAKTGGRVELEEKIDPSILGGVVVIIKDTMIDGSVKYKLSLLREELMKLKVA